jgi:chromosome segregation ATPase
MGIGILEKFFPAKAAITSATIRNEIESANTEIAAHCAKIDGMMDDIAAMTDEQHVAAEANVAALHRAITRLQARVSLLNDELLKVEAAEAAAQAAAKDEALRQRAEAARKANTVESKKLLAEIDKLSCQMGDVLARLNEIADETNSVNGALRSNPVADSIVGFETLYRKHPAGHYELPLSAIVLPPAFSGGTARWPRLQ